MSKWNKAWTAMAVLTAVPALAAQVAPTTPRERVENRQERRSERREAVRDTLEGRAALPADRASDAQIAGMLAPANQEEIALAKLAQDRSQNAAVKEFAQQLEQDHAKFLEQLKSYRGRPALDASQAPTAGAPIADQPQPGAVDVNAPGVEVQAGRGEVEVTTPGTDRPVRVAAPAAHGFDVVAISQQIAQRCLARTQQMLEQKQGAEFDKCFVGGQIGGHVAMLAKLEVLSGHASPKLRSVLEQGIQTTEQHLAHAEQLAKQLDGARDQARR